MNIKKGLGTSLICFLSACSSVTKVSVPETKKEPKNPILALSHADTAKPMPIEMAQNEAIEAPTADTEPLAVIRVKNYSSHDRIQWFRATVPLARNAVMDDELETISTTHGNVSALAIKHWFKNGKAASVQIMKLTFPLFLRAGQEVNVPVYKGKKKRTLPFGFGPNMHAFLGSDIQNIAFIGLKLKNDSKIYYAPFWQSPKVLEDTPDSKTFQFTSQFENLGLVANYTMTLDNRQDFGEFVVGVHHGLFQVVKSGGYDIEYAKLYFKKPFKIKIRSIDSTHASVKPDESGFGVIELFRDQNLADASGRVFRGQWQVVFDPASLTASSALANFERPGLGMAKTEYWKKSKAGGIVGNVIPRRGDLSTLRQALAPKCSANNDVKVSVAYPQFINRSPGQAGDQPAFSSNMHWVEQHAIVSESGCMPIYALHNSQVEELRPSYYFFKKGDTIRRMKWTDTGSKCFWWSGRPHYFVGHFRECQEWASRARDGGFNEGNNYGYRGEDDQHWGQAGLRGAFEITGDAYLKDLMHYRMSMALWNKLGDYDWQYNRMGSERAVRLGLSAVELAKYNAHSEIAEEVIPRLGRFMRLRLTGGCFAGGAYCSPGIDQNFDRYAVYGLENIVDGRFPLSLGVTAGARCRNGNLCEPNNMFITWWSGFSMTFAYQMIKTGIEPSAGQEFINKYMTMADFYWDEQGRNASARRVNDWSVKRDPFTQSWHSGWFSAVESYGQSHPRFSFFKEKVLPTREWAFSPSQQGAVFSTTDKWYQ